MYLHHLTCFKQSLDDVEYFISVNSIQILILNYDKKENLISNSVQMWFKNAHLCDWHPPHRFETCIHRELTTLLKNFGLYGGWCGKHLKGLKDRSNAIWLSFSFFFLIQGFCVYVVLVTLKFSMQIKLALNSQNSIWLFLISAGIAGVYHYTWLTFVSKAKFYSSSYRCQ